MVKQRIDGIEFRLKEYQDLSWLSNYGKVFSVIDETGSGCISFGIEKDKKKYFYKIAGANTINAEVSTAKSIELLKKAITKYKEIKTNNLIKLVNSFEYKEFYVAVFEYATGECLFDHWNFEKYKATRKVAPMAKLKKLSIGKRLDVVYDLFLFFKDFINCGYVAVDFYDSSIIYNFRTEKVTFCDIDLFEKMPYMNNIGENYYGTKRLKAPEENELGATIDEQTSLFTLGAIIFDMFSKVVNNDERYNRGIFIPNKLENFELSEETYKVLLKATNYDKRLRYETIKEFEKEFRKSLLK